MAEEQNEIVNEGDMLAALEATYHLLRVARPTDRSERARRYAVVITEYEKMLSYYKTMIHESAWV